MSLTVAIRHFFSDFILDLNFETGPGITALFGRSGAGKTTVINAIAGLLRPDHARISIDGDILTDSATHVFLPPYRRRIGYVFQDARLFPHLNVAQNLDYGARFAPRKSRPDLRRRQEIIDLLGIGNLLNRHTRALSGGEKQRVALGRAILSAPRLLLMDEPLAALDEARKAEILPYLEGLRDLGLPILYVSHSLPEITRLAGHVVMLDAGRVITSGPAEAVLSNPASIIALGREAGALITAKVIAQDADGLARLETSAGPIWAARPDLDTGTIVRLRIHAQEVMLSAEVPRHISALNILRGRIDQITTGPDGHSMVRIDLGGGTVILSQITTRSRDALRLCPGMQVHAVIKTVSIAELGQR